MFVWTIVLLIAAAAIGGLFYYVSTRRVHRLVREKKRSLVLGHILSDLEYNAAKIEAEALLAGKSRHVRVDRTKQMASLPDSFAELPEAVKDLFQSYGEVTIGEYAQIGPSFVKAHAEDQSLIIIGRDPQIADYAVRAGEDTIYELALEEGPRDGGLRYRSLYHWLLINYVEHCEAEVE